MSPKQKKYLGNQIDVGGVTVQKIEQYLHKCGEVWPIFWIVRPAPQQHAPSVSMQKHYIPHFFHMILLWKSNKPLKTDPSHVPSPL